MIEKVGQTSSNFFENTHQKNTTQNTAQPTNKKDEFIRSSGKNDLWSYSIKEVKSPIVRSYSAFGSVPAPNWNFIPTKGGRTLSYEEISEQIKSLAQREAIMENSNTYESESGNIVRIKQYLYTQYISDVSPDRKTLYEQAEKELQKMKKEQQPTYPVNITLVDILCDMDEVEGLNSNHGTITTSYTTGYGEDYEINMGNQRVMNTLRGRWSYEMTPLENMKKDEFFKIYNMEKEQSKKMLDKQ